MKQVLVGSIIAFLDNHRIAHAMPDTTEKTSEKPLSIPTLFGSNTTLRKQPGSATVYELTLTLELFQSSSGGYILNTSAPPQAIASTIDKTDDSTWGDMDYSPIQALHTDLTTLLQRFETAHGTVYADTDDGRVQRDFQLVKDITYTITTNHLSMLLQWTDDQQPIPRPTDPCIVTNKTLPGDLTPACRADLTLTMYDIFIQLTTSSPRGAHYNTAEAIESCDPWRMVQLNCNGPLCRQSLYSVGLYDGWDAGSQGYHNLATAKQCCDLIQLCSKSENVGIAQCKEVDDDSAWWGMTVGALDKPGFIDWQAGCQPTCVAADGLDESQWKPCRYNRQRCVSDCRCSFFCG